MHYSMHKERENEAEGTGLKYVIEKVIGRCLSF